MSDDLYQREILDRAKSTAHTGRIAAPDASITLDNPLCGDRVILDIKLAGATIGELKHQVRGCALCQASASVMADIVIGRTQAEARNGGVALKAFLTGDALPPLWGRLDIFAPVRGHKSRHDCVKLPFEALDRALSQTPAK